MYETLLGKATTRRVFFSFHYQNDIWRVNQVKNHWIAKDDRTAAGYFNGSLEEVAKTKGDAAVKKLIDDGMKGSSVTCVLIGSETYNRKWVQYEVFNSIKNGMGVFGVRIHKQKDQHGQTATFGPDPFGPLRLASAGSTNLQPQVNYKESGWTAHPNADTVTRGNAVYLPNSGNVNLSGLFPVYDWVDDDGFNNFATWTQSAATHAAR